MIILQSRNRITLRYATDMPPVRRASQASDQVSAPQLCPKLSYYLKPRPALLQHRIHSVSNPAPLNDSKQITQTNDTASVRQCVPLAKETGLSFHILFLFFSLSLSLSVLRLNAVYLVSPPIGDKAWNVFLFLIFSQRA